MQIEVAPHFTSQDCSSCGNRVKKDLSVRVHNCLKCGLSLHRDIVSAKVILKRAVGQTVEELTYGSSHRVSSESSSITASV